MFNHILVPLDGSRLAERPIAHAEQFARVFGGKITLLQVLDPSSYQENPGIIEPLNWQLRKAEVEMYLQGVAEKIRENGITVDYAVREGRTSENIIDYAHGEQVELVVLSTHGASGLSRWNTSSVVAKVLEKIYLPVLLIRAYQEADERKQESASHTEYQPVSYQRIGLPIDFSRRAECALPAATTLARNNPGQPATVIISAVIDPPDLPIPAPYPEEIRQLIDRFLEVSHSAVETYLSDLTQRLQTPCETRIVESDNIANALHQMANEDNIDLMVLCAHGQTGGTQWPYGSVARNYLDYGTKNVLVIQDVPLSQVQPTVSELAAERYGRR